MRINAHADNINAHLKDQKGMTLLEVVVAMSLLTFITLGLMFMVGSSYRAVTASKERSQAVSLSSTFLELLGTIPYDDLVKFDNVNTSNTATFPTNTQFKNICISWRNQIADLMNYSTAYGLVDVETNTPVSGRTRITVYVFWPRGDEFRSVNIVEVKNMKRFRDKKLFHAKECLSNCRGFTLVEILAALGVFTIISMVALSAISNTTQDKLLNDLRMRANETARDTMNLIYEDIQKAGYQIKPSSAALPQFIEVINNALGPYQLKIRRTVAPGGLLKQQCWRQRTEKVADII